MPLHKLFSGFKPEEKGLNKVLGQLETEVMEVLWQKGQASVRDVHERLAQKREIAYTTVMTTMNRLVEKQLLTKEKQGLAYFYTPVYSKKDFIKMFVQQVFDGLWEEYSELTFAHFLGRIQADDQEKIAQLEKILQERLRKGDKP